MAEVACDTVVQKLTGTLGRGRIVPQFQMLIPPLEQIAVRIDDPIPPGPAEVFDGLLPKGGQLVIAGPTNSGKSLIGIEICSAFITGIPLWGALTPSSRATKILYVLAEHQNSVIQKLYQKTQLSLQGGDVFLLGPEQLSYNKWLVSKGQPNLQAIEKFKRWADGCDLIVWDPFSAFVTGEDAEQDNITMRLALDIMGSVCQSTGATCLVLAHQGKPQMDSTGKEHSRKSYAIRGASSVEDAATCIYYLNTTDEPATFELQCRKYKGEAPEMFRLLRDPQTLTHTLLGTNPKDAYNEARRIGLNGKLSRILSHNDKFTWRTGLQILAASEGIPEETLKKYLGNGTP